jgi:SRSO17 transposase
VAASLSVDGDLALWQAGLEELLGLVAGRFGRVESRWRARSFVRGLLADLPRKNCWTLAEHAGDPSPDGMQHLLARAVWDHDGVRDDIRAYLVEHLGDPDGVLVVDETGDRKKGTQTVGVQRQYTGTAGRVVGPVTRTAARLPVSPIRWGLRPSRPWPRPCSAARWTRACQPAG